ncbi:exodeoxyribonuclease VII small subunit [bacterium BMS3Abin07]|nr:exodeoxyribonuclease VII small subunit [bacterium BMS3Abin07]GBE32959.1 exodeoxyribonuclease VII small subunit [bacterium BMS3Bbin05]HDL20618.1 exodeoxyribonuclease VII small subunit [Nitrospirota bacterium]HDO21448.1 exodeoxyribonuclease VII small subunit [Nitrospirota bacterium]
MAKKKQQTYKEALEEIEKIISEIENETIDIDVLAVKVKHASELIKSCRQKLAKTEKEVNKVLEEFEEESAEETGEETEGKEELFS